MKNIMKKSFYTILGTLFLTQTALTHAAIDFDKEAIDDGIQGTSDTADVAVQKLVGTISTFLAIVAVLFGIYGGFLILTAAWDEEKVKKGKTILVQAILGLVVIWIASSVITWIVGVLGDSSAGW